MDVRGHNIEDGVYLVDKYLDDVYLGNYPFVRIIHGKGTGVLQKGIWSYLKNILI
ncbi:Smr/MutS family protein [endosymbiont 'TC1' of Trimyema compressum]|uniref:Smr/MutS family protein n=1 Tax=endosymbiont 'TC1' of Trimyema compressum TaxID=243899 RepID=UPI000B4C5CEA|nr:Smr/MutS family protein [endosymbiont 'TC1' of Trimyema compressum]